MSFPGRFCVVLLAAATAAAAADDRWAQEFALLDANGDGRLQVEEVLSRGALASHFPLADADGNGSLDAAEFSAFEEALKAMSEPPPSGRRM